MPERRDPFLLLAVALSALLLLTLTLVPAAFWRFPLAIAGGVWAPGYALIVLAWPRGKLSGSQRHALAAAAGLLLLPVVGLVTSETLGFRAAAVALVGLALTTTCAALALRRPYAPEPPTRSPMPSTRATVLAASAALLASAALVAPSFVVADVPASLALMAADGGPAPVTWPADAPPRLLLRAFAGSGDVETTMVVQWDGAERFLDRRLAVAAGASVDVPFTPPTDDAGPHELLARWGEREVRILVEVTPS